MSLDITTCECGARFFFMRAKPSDQNPIPKLSTIDEKPSPDGNLLVNFGLNYYQVVKKPEVEKNKLLPKPQPLYISHFATCPKKTKFKK